jgi:hypothetical protein
MTTKTDVQTKLAIFIPAVGVPSVVNLLNPDYGDELGNLQFAVEGFVQAVSLAQDLEGLVLWSNEEAKLVAGMAFNPLATQIWQESFQGYPWGGDDYILGNAVLTLEADDEGETVGMTEDLAMAFIFDLSNLMGL